MRYVKDNEWGTVFPNFQKWEFMCNHKSVGNGIFYSLVQVMQEVVRNRYGSVTNSCGYRCPECNALVGGASNSAHLYGGACDFRIDNGWQDNLQNRMALVTELRKDERVHYCYCQVNNNTIWNGYEYVNTPCNMGVYIHVDTYGDKYRIPLEDFKVENIGEDFVKIAFVPDNGSYDYAKYSLNGSDFIDLPITNTIGNLKPKTKYKVKITLRAKGTNLWTESKEIEFTTKDIPKETQEMPLKEEELVDSPITLPDTETSQNDPLNKEKTLIQIFKELFIKIIKLLGGKYEKSNKEIFKK